MKFSERKAPTAIVDQPAGRNLRIASSRVTFGLRLRMMMTMKAAPA
jgi:hypothetical protein